MFEPINFLHSLINNIGCGEQGELHPTELEPGTEEIIVFSEEKIKELYNYPDEEDADVKEYIDAFVEAREWLRPLWGMTFDEQGVQYGFTTNDSNIECAVFRLLENFDEEED